MCILAHSEDPDEMWLHCLLLNTKNIFKEKEIQFYFESITCDPWIYTMDHAKFILSN